jgi:hypothetical protein
VSCNESFNDDDDDVFETAETFKRCRAVFQTDFQAYRKIHALLKLAPRMKVSAERPFRN